MADIKISELGAASAVNATDIFPMTSAGITVKATAQQIKNYMGVGNLSDLNTTDKSSSVSAINEVNEKKADQSTLAIVETGDTCTHTGGIAQGQYMIWKGELYTADSNIAVGTTFASSGGGKNLTAVVDGGLNSQIKVRYLDSGIHTPTTRTGSNLYVYTYNYSSEIQDIISNHFYLTSIAQFTYTNENYSAGFMHLMNQPQQYTAYGATNDANHPLAIGVAVFYI